MEYKTCPECGADNPMWAYVCQYPRCNTPLNNKEMSNQLQINPPDGYEIDQDKSDLSKGVIHFKESKTLTYNDLCNKLFINEDFYFTSERGVIYTAMDSDSGKCYKTENIHSNNSITAAQLESILALNKLCNVAKYLNGDWLPILNDYEESKYYHFINGENKLSTLQLVSKNFNYGSIYFKSKELVQQAIEILGEEEIRKALTLNH